MPLYISWKLWDYLTGDEVVFISDTFPILCCKWQRGRRGPDTETTCCSPRNWNYKTKQKQKATQLLIVTVERQTHWGAMVVEQDLGKNSKHRAKITSYGVNINFTDFIEIPGQGLLNKPQTITLIYMQPTEAIFAYHHALPFACTLSIIPPHICPVYLRHVHRGRKKALLCWGRRSPNLFNFCQCFHSPLFMCFLWSSSRRGISAHQTTPHL